jgi:hypothetical protein
MNKDNDRTGSNKKGTNRKQVKEILKDVDSYSVDELKELLGFLPNDNEYTVDDIGEMFVILRSKYQKLARNGFLDKAEKRILETVDMNPDATPQINTDPPKMQEWWQNEVLEPSNPADKIKITNRKNKIETYPDENGEHQTMKQEQLGIYNSYVVQTAQDTLNPTLKNTNVQHLVIDSQFRQNISPYTPSSTGTSSSTDFTLDLSDHIKNALSLKLYSYQIPYSWYTVDATLGTSCFSVEYKGSSYSIQLDDGNYSRQQLIREIQIQLDASLNLADSDISNNHLDISYNPVNGRSVFYFAQQHTTTPPLDVNIIFYNKDKYNSCNGLCGNTMKVNNNLGWLLGYRTISDVDLTIVVDASYNYINTSIPPKIINGVWSQSSIDVYGTKYLMVVLDDFNQNHLNSGLINIVDTDTTLSVPDYFNESIPSVCAPDPALNNTVSPFYVQSLPRSLTKVQIDSINKRLDSMKNTYKHRITGPTTTDVFAVIPLRKQGFEAGDMIVDLGSSLMINTRTYFGPVNITRMRVTLQDDKGNVINMHGADWSISIIVETLYQY